MIIRELDLGATSGYASLRRPVGGHSMGLVESGLITKTLVLVAPGLVLVVSGYEPPGLCFSP